jgi:hypothetical protein
MNREKILVASDKEIRLGGDTEDGAVGLEPSP